MLIVVMPAYNEEKTVGDVVRQTKKYADKVVVVNDASSDKTAEIAKRSGAQVISHDKNRGLGGALRTGFVEALEAAKPNDIIITLDSDGQHRPEDIPKFVAKINEGNDFVLGARDIKKYPLRKRFGNAVLTALTNIVSGTSLSDTESGFRAFRAAALTKLDLRAERYQIAAEIILEVGRKKLRAANVSIESPRYRKGVTVRQGLQNFGYLLKRKLLG
jgi:glycosyltransferase involved in cell wall biosynthesis